MIVSNNVKSHIKNLVGNKNAPQYNKVPKNKQYLGQPVDAEGPVENGPYDPEMKNQRPKSANQRPTQYYQPNKFVHPDYRKHKRLPMETLTKYQQDYVGYNPDYRKQSKLVRDNLVVGHPTHFPKQTEYKRAHTPNGRGHGYDPNNPRMFQINKMNDKTTHLISKNMPITKDTEYQRRYQKKLVPKMNVCPIDRLPRVPSHLKRQPDHIYFSKSHRNWYADRH